MPVLAINDALITTIEKLTIFNYLPMTTYFKIFLTVCLLIAFNSCDSKRSITLEPELKKIIGDDVKSWLKKAPFDGYWDPYEENNGDYVFTNIKEVFPFAGAFSYAAGNFRLNPNMDSTLVYDQHSTVFKDPYWGETVLHATLLYDPVELYVSSNYSASANILFSGTSNLNQRYYASLMETQVVENNNNYKTGIYWINANNQEYLSGFYQRGQLAFQFAFPFKDSLKAVQQVKKISKKMELDVPEWQDISLSDLKRNNNPTSFWENPSVGFYMDRFGYLVYLKLKDTDFVKDTSKKLAGDPADFLYHIPNTATLFTLKKNIEERTLDNYEKKMKDMGAEVVLNEYQNKIFLTKNNHSKIEANVYLKEHQTLTITAQFDPEDQDAKKDILELLYYMQISRF